MIRSASAAGQTLSVPLIGRPTEFYVGSAPANATFQLTGFDNNGARITVALTPVDGQISITTAILDQFGNDNRLTLQIQGLNQGQSFDQIERALAEACPELKSPLVPRNVPWFTVRAQDFPNPELASQILDLHGEDRGEGRRLYRFPVVFPTDRWQSVMPHELATWGAQDKRFWSEYSTDGRWRHCMTHAPVPVDATGRRTVRLFGGRKAIPREDNGGLCQPES